MIVKLKEYVLRMLFKRMKLETIVAFLKGRKTKGKLTIGDKSYPYLFHSYNNMGITERSAEIPIIYDYLTRSNSKNVLEIGNVTNYYEDYFSGVFPNKTVVDKIEITFNVITSDIAMYKSEKKFDFIFSISTFEHMDSDLDRNPDYRPGSSKLCSVAADNIFYCYENLLETGGKMVITAPMGYTPEWDLTFKSDSLDKANFKSLKRRLFKKTSEEEWIELEKYNPNSEMAYNKPYPYANYIAIIEILK
jgi:hypothetical protein